MNTVVQTNERPRPIRGTFPMFAHTRSEDGVSWINVDNKSQCLEVWGFIMRWPLPEQIPQSEDARCVLVGCFAVGGASVEACIRMLGCTLTNGPASQMNWAVGDQKISMNKKTPFRDTWLQDVHDSLQQVKAEKKEALEIIRLSV